MKSHLHLTCFKKHFVLLSLFCVCLVLLPSYTAFGQGSLKGIISASDENTPLVSASVKIKGTTTGVASGYNGDYFISLKAGTYTIEFSYMGYETLLDTVSIADGKTTTLNVNLTPMLIMGKEVIVTAQAFGQISAVNQQVRSNQIINVVSAERIRELPDQNAAQAISRLPGITLDGSKVVIRGIESKMNKIMINGIEMPSTESASRSTDLGMVSANMLSGIEVFKTLTPDMDADAIGGVVNLRMREAPNGFHVSLTGQGAYNTQEDLISDKIFWGDISNRFFKNKFGVLLNINLQERNGGEEWWTSSFEENGSFPIGDPRVSYYRNAVNVYDQQRTVKNYGGSLVLDYTLPTNGKLIYTGMLSHTNPEEILYRDNMDMKNNYRFFHLDHNEYNSLLLNNSLRLEQQIGIVKLDASFSKVSIDRKDEYRYEARFKDDADPKPFSGVEPNIRTTMEAEDIYNLAVDSAANYFRWYANALDPYKYSESQTLFDLNLQVPLKVSDNIDITFKVGGKYNKKDREYDLDHLQYVEISVHEVNAQLAPWYNEMGITYNAGELGYFREFRDEDYKTNEGFMNNSSRFNMKYAPDVDLIDEMFLVQMNRDYASVNPNMLTAGGVKDDYWGTETKTAGYAMAEINLGKKVTIIPGIRYESLTSDYTAYKTQDVSKTYWDTIKTINTKVTHEHFFPHFHARFRATEWWDIRFSYNQTISRPDYDQQIPMIYVNETAGSGEAGNPYIKPAIAENFDLNMSFYTRKMGLFTIGGYIKSISNIFYLQKATIKNLPDTLIRNEFPSSMMTNQIDYYLNDPHIGKVKGFEVEWQSNFSWLPAPFNGIVLNANYSHVWSEQKYVQNRILNEYVWTINANGDSVRSRIRLPVQRDTTFMNRLLNQGNDMANVSVGYDYKGFSARLSFRFQGNVISRIGERLEENEYTNDIYAYDFAVKQKIPVKSADIEIFLNAINFTSVPQTRYSLYPNKPGRTTTYARYSGAQYQLGVRLKF